jgi:phosphate transport system protein
MIRIPALGVIMREQYQDSLKHITEDLAEMSRLVEAAMSKATKSLLDANLTLADEVIAEDDAIDELGNKIENQTMAILALQQPVASDLRLLAGALKISSTLERMGDLASHVAKQARLRHPNLSIPRDFLETFSKMGDIANEVIRRSTRAIAAGDIEQAIDISRAEVEMDVLHRALFEKVLSDDWTHGVEAAIDITLLGRYYERFADHGVALARRVAYILTGQMPAKE